MNDLINVISSFYEILGLERTASEGDLYGILSICAILGVSFLFVLTRKQLIKKDSFKEAKPQELSSSDGAPESGVKADSVPLSWAQRVNIGLSRSRKEVWGKIGELLSAKSTGLDEESIEEIEEILFSADIGPTAVMEIIEVLEEKVNQSDETFGPKELKKFLRSFINEKLFSIQQSVDTSLYEYNTNEQRDSPQVIMVVGVNGAGKTTTIGKLATKLTAQGAKVVVGACDTFRAAAVDQLGVWCKRANATMIRAKEGSNPSGVGFEALSIAKKEKADYCILDTAGRLHTKANLMDELTKSRDVLKKIDPSAPHHTLLVIDAITGQNALRQAEEFHRALGLTGLILTKCDGSSKAGSAVGIVQKLKVPVVYIGVGEQVEDLDRFEVATYLDGLLGREEGHVEDVQERAEKEPSSIDVSP